MTIYKSNKEKIRILNDIDEFYSVIESDSIIYIGTRLHGGIKAMQKGVQSLILSIDNRAKEISKDINLPIAERSDIKSVESWLEGNTTFQNIKLNLDNIRTWKSQFES